ncbi:response regulator, partial [bacterium]|nr:response regulator [bacterium]
MSAQPTTTRLLIADDDQEILTLLEDILESEGYQITTVKWGKAAYSALQNEHFNLLLTDLQMPDISGFQLLEMMAQEQPDLPILVITGSTSTQDAVQAIKKGALDFIEKPFDVKAILHTVKKALEVGRLRSESRLLAEELAKPYHLDNIVGNDPRMMEIYSLIQDVASANTTVLVVGESGTGKELISQAIHYNSPRGRKPLVKVNCVTLSESLLESELFGH